MQPGSESDSASPGYGNSMVHFENLKGTEDETSYSGRSAQFLNARGSGNRLVSLSDAKITGNRANHKVGPPGFRTDIFIAVSFSLIYFRRILKH